MLTRVKNVEPIDFSSGADPVDFLARLWLKEDMRTRSTTLQLSRPAL